MKSTIGYANLPTNRHIHHMGHKSQCQCLHFRKENLSDKYWG